MVAVDLFVDAEALVSAIIRTALSANVHSSKPKSPVYPLILVQRLGGLPVHRARLDAADLQFDVWADTKSDVWADTKSQARLLAVRARQAVWAAEGTTYTTPDYPADAFITGVEDSVGLTWLPDPQDPTKNRYTFGMRIFLHKS